MNDHTDAHVKIPIPGVLVLGNEKTLKDTTCKTSNTNSLDRNSSSVRTDALSDLRLRGSVPVEDKPSYSSGFIKPFQKTSVLNFSAFTKHLKIITADQRSTRIFLLGILNLLCTSMLLIWCHSTSSIALTAYTYLTIFDFMMLLACLLSFWVEQQSPCSVFTYGYERFEVLAVFASTILAQLGSLFIIKESIERLLLRPDIQMKNFLIATTIAFMCHIVITYGINNKSLNHVISAATSSWLQEHVADMSQSVCYFIPGLSNILLPRVNPMLLIAFTGGIALFLSYFLIEINNYQMADPLAAISIALMTCGTMFPMTVYSGKMLLQTTPSHIVGQLDKCLREASTLDGVLEFRNEHFWTLSFGLLVGSLHVRIRRDANEQLVLAHITDRLSNLVSLLTIQIFKDDWTRSTTFQLLNDTALLSVTKNINSPVSSDNSSLYKSASSPINVVPSVSERVSVSNMPSWTSVNKSSEMEKSALPQYSSQFTSTAKSSFSTESLDHLTFPKTSVDLTLFRHEHR